MGLIYPEAAHSPKRWSFPIAYYTSTPRHGIKRIINGSLLVIEERRQKKNKKTTFNGADSMEKGAKKTDNLQWSFQPKTFCDPDQELAQQLMLL